MTIINLRLGRDAVDVVSDTLSTTLDLVPVGFSTKVLTLPHLPALVGVSSAGMLTAEVYRYAIVRHVEGGVEELGRRLAGALPRMQEHLASVCGPEPVRQGVVLLAGWDAARGRFAAFRLASWAAAPWSPEELAEGCHGEPDIIDNWSDARDLGDLVAVAELHHRLDRYGITIRPLGELPEIARAPLAA